MPELKSDLNKTQSLSMCFHFSCDSSFDTVKLLIDTGKEIRWKMYNTQLKLFKF